MRSTLEFGELMDPGFPGAFRAWIYQNRPKRSKEKGDDRRWKEERKDKQNEDEEMKIFWGSSLCIFHPQVVLKGDRLHLHQHVLSTARPNHVGPQVRNHQVIQGAPLGLQSGSVSLQVSKLSVEAMGLAWRPMIFQKAAYFFGFRFASSAIFMKSW